MHDTVPSRVRSTQADSTASFGFFPGKGQVALSRNVLLVQGRCGAVTDVSGSDRPHPSDLLLSLPGRLMSKVAKQNQIFLPTRRWKSFTGSRGLSTSVAGLERCASNNSSS